MTTSKDLMLAILAMDSYNREYGQGLDVTATQIGSATFNDHKASDVSDATFAAWQTAGFYAAAYTIGEGVDGIASGSTVISYRGTDNLSLNSFGASDIWNGWISAVGIPTSQVGFAYSFY